MSPWITLQFGSFLFWTGIIKSRNPSYLLPNVFKLLHSLPYFFHTSIYFTWNRREKQIGSWDIFSFICIPDVWPQNRTRLRNPSLAASSDDFHGKTGNSCALCGVFCLLVASPSQHQLAEACLEGPEVQNHLTFTRNQIYFTKNMTYTTHGCLPSPQRHVCPKMTNQSIILLVKTKVLVIFLFLSKC